MRGAYYTSPGLFLFSSLRLTRGFHVSSGYMGGTGLAGVMIYGCLRPLFFRYYTHSSSHRPLIYLSYHSHTYLLLLAYIDSFVFHHFLHPLFICRRFIFHRLQKSSVYPRERTLQSIHISDFFLFSHLLELSYAEVTVFFFFFPYPFFLLNDHRLL